jgi:hypothetical protein
MIPTIAVNIWAHWKLCFRILVKENMQIEVIDGSTDDNVEALVYETGRTKVLQEAGEKKMLEEPA